MSSFFLEYGIFLAKFLTVILCFIGLIALAGYAATQYEETSGRLVVHKLNKDFNYLKKALAKNESEDEDEDDESETKRKKVYLLNFNGDVEANGITFLRREITAILQNAKSTDEVVLKLESPGGLVHSYGFAASQLDRFRKKNIPLTVCVDHIAASGGYMMACVANNIVAAPFAIIGSIGVVAEVPNFHRFLKNRDIDVDIYTAGKHKRTVTTLGENTEEGKEKFKKELEDTHGLFKDHIKQYRSDLDIESLATGECWYGSEALNKGLIDQIGTSDDLLLEYSRNSDIYSVRFVPLKSFRRKASSAAEAVIKKVFIECATFLQKQRILRS